MKNQLSLNQNNKELTILYIQLGENEKKTIKIYNDSNPEQIAYDFCIKNNLDFESLQQITFQIKQAIQPKEELTLMEQKFEKDIQIEDKTDEPNLSLINNNKKEQNNNNLDLSDLPESREERKDNLKTSQNNKKLIEQKNVSFGNTSFQQKPKNKKPSYLSPTESYSSKIKVNNDNIQKEFNNISFSYGNTNDYINNQSNINNNIQQVNKSNISSCKNLKQFQNKNININNTLNYGERLYHKGLKLQDKTNQKLNILKLKIEKVNQKNNTFYPKVNKISYNALSKRFANKSSYNDEDKIIYYKEYKEQRLNKLKLKYNKNENYSFTPSLNKRSLTMSKYQTTQKTPRYEQLYNSYKKHEVNLTEKTNEIYNKNKMFKPKINKYQCPYTNISFEERQKYYLSKSQEKQKILSNQLQNPSDSITGQRFFHPEINSNYERPNIENFDIFQNLYQEHFRKEIKQEQTQRETFNKEYLQRTQGHVNETSLELVEMKKEKAFQKIFQHLDKDKDGLISRLNIATKALPLNIQSIIEPIIIELQRENLTLNEGDFINACFNLYDDLKFIERRTILDFVRNEGIKNKKFDNLNKFTFKPTINKYDSNISKHNNLKGKNSYIKNLQTSCSNQQYDKNKIKSYSILFGNVKEDDEMLNIKELGSENGDEK